MPIVEIRGVPFAHFLDRTRLKEDAQYIAHAVRDGDHRLLPLFLDGYPELEVLGVRDAVLGRTEIPHVPWSETPLMSPGGRAGTVSSSIASMTGLEFGMSYELNTRGAALHKIRAYANPPQLGTVLPSGVIATELNRASAEVLNRLVDAGVTVVNPHTDIIGKSHAAEVWQATDVPTPPTRTRLATDDDIAAAFEQLGPEVVLKNPFAARGEGVRAAASVDEAIAAAHDLSKPGTLATYGDLAHPIMQPRLDIGGSDLRVHFARDPKTGLLLPNGAVERASVTDGEFRTGLSTGGAVRPIFDLTGGDHALTPAALDAGRRAGDALGLDWFATDIAHNKATGAPTVFEVDVHAVPLELHFPVAREHHTYLRLGNLLLHSNNATLDAARGATLRTATTRT